MGAADIHGLVEVLEESQVRRGMYDDLRHRLLGLLAREPTLYPADEWSWIQAHCRSAQDDPHLRRHVFPAYSLSLKVPTEKTVRSRDGALIPVAQNRLPQKPEPEPGVSYSDPVQEVRMYALGVIRSIERMILGKSRDLADGSPIIGLANHPDRRRLPALDWSPEGQEGSLERLKHESFASGPIFYGIGVRSAYRDWSNSSHQTVQRQIWYETGKRAYTSPYLDEGEAVFVGPTPSRWLSGPKWPHPKGVPVVFEGLPPTVVERRPEDFDPDPPPENERGEPWLTVMAIAGPWIPEPEGIVHFGGKGE